MATQKYITRFVCSFLCGLYFGLGLLAQQESPEIHLFEEKDKQQMSATIDSLARAAGLDNAQGNYLSAIQTYNRIIALDPENGKWYLNRGQDYAMLRNFKRAEADYSEAIRRQPKLFDAYLSRAILYFSLEEHEKSINDYNHALRNTTDLGMQVFVLNNRGNAKAGRTDLKGAHADFLRAHALDSFSVVTLNNLGKTLNLMGRGDEALYYFRKLLTFDSSDIAARSEIGYTLLSLHRFEESIAEYDVILASDPNQPLALSNRSIAKLNLSDFSGALTDASQSILLMPDNAYAFRNRALIFISIEKNTEGCADLEKSLELGFSRKYDTEVETLYKQHCPRK
jgi:tetratricopeptide (TPR) repeat protein